MNHFPEIMTVKPHQRSVLYPPPLASELVLFAMAARAE